MSKLFRSSHRSVSRVLTRISTPVKRLSIVGATRYHRDGHRDSHHDGDSERTTCRSSPMCPRISCRKWWNNCKSAAFLFESRDNGATILISKDLLHSTQMAIMTELGGAKVGHVGLELFDKQDFGTTSYAQKINYQRALQGELMRAINTLSAVKQSKVILALPQKKTFLEESWPAVRLGRAGAQSRQDAFARSGSRHYLFGFQCRGKYGARKGDGCRFARQSLSRTWAGETAGSGEIMEMKQKVEESSKNASKRSCKRSSAPER